MLFRSGIQHCQRCPRSSFFPDALTDVLTNIRSGGLKPKPYPPIFLQPSRRLNMDYKVPPGTSVSVKVSCAFISACLTKTKKKMSGYKNIHHVFFFLQRLKKKLKKPQKTKHTSRNRTHRSYSIWKICTLLLRKVSSGKHRTEYDPVQLVILYFILAHFHIRCLFSSHVIFICFLSWIINIKIYWGMFLFSIFLCFVSELYAAT